MVASAARRQILLRLAIHPSISDHLLAKGGAPVEAAPDRLVLEPQGAMEKVPVLILNRRLIAVTSSGSPYDSELGNTINNVLASLVVLDEVRSYSTVSRVLPYALRTPKASMGGDGRQGRRPSLAVGGSSTWPLGRHPLLSSGTSTTRFEEARQSRLQRPRMTRRASPSTTRMVLLALLDLRHRSFVDAHPPWQPFAWLLPALRLTF